MQQFGNLFAQVISADKPFLYIADLDTQITNIALDPSSTSKPSSSSTAISPVVVKIQFEARKLDDAEDEEDEEDPEDVEALTEMKEIVICSLIPGQILQAQVNVFLREDDQYRFVVSGGTHDVHLLGHYVHQPDMDQTPTSSEADSDEDSDEFDELEVDSDDEIEAEETSRIQELDASDDEEPKSKKGSKKRQAEEQDEEEVGDVSMADSVEETGKLSKSQRKKLAKKLKAASGEAVPAPASAPPAPTTTTTKKDKTKAEKPGSTPAPAATTSKLETVTLSGGLKYVETTPGSGPSAKPGQKVSMRYIGKLSNGKVFDSNTKGDAFRFVLGKGEVIKGWDEGLKGMKVGGQRKLVIPPGMDGKRGAPPDIPANATLTFEVKMLKIN